MGGRDSRTVQCQKPSGWVGRLLARRMNSGHSKLTDWGLSHVAVRENDIVLDVGCGGGRTVSKLAAMAAQGKVYGVDFSRDSLAIAREENHRLIDIGRVELRQGSVSELPFANDTFDVVTAVETHFWWPDLPNGLRQVQRVIKPSGHFVIIAEVYKGAVTKIAKLAGIYAAHTGMHFLDLDEHRRLLEDAGFCDVQIIERREKAWLCCVGLKPRG